MRCCDPIGKLGHALDHATGWHSAMAENVTQIENLRYILLTKVIGCVLPDC